MWRALVISPYLRTNQVSPVNSPVGASTAGAWAKASAFLDSSVLPDRVFPVQLKAGVLQHVLNRGLDSAGGPGRRGERREDWLEFVDLVVGIDWWMTPGEIFVGRGGAVVEACRIHAERGEYVLFDESLVRFSTGNRQQMTSECEIGVTIHPGLTERYNLLDVVRL